MPPPTDPVEELRAPAGEAALPSVFGDVGDAEKTGSVIFLCGSFPAAPPKASGPKSELRKAVLGLKPEQSFDVVFVADHDSLSAFPGGVLVSASRDHKRSALRFIDNITFPDAPDPLPALEKAFAAGPATLYVFTDGNLPHADKIAQRLRELNAAGRVRVNPVVLQTGRPEDPGSIDVLKHIAADNGGKYRHATEREIQNPQAQQGP